jgi:hypothetical protein
VYVVGYIHVFLEFFETWNCQFQKKSNKGLRGTWVPNWYFDRSTPFRSCPKGISMHRNVVWTKSDLLHRHALSLKKGIVDEVRMSYFGSKEGNLMRTWGQNWFSFLTPPIAFWRREAKGHAWNALRATPTNEQKPKVCQKLLGHWKGKNMLQQIT